MPVKTAVAPGDESIPVWKTIPALASANNGRIRKAETGRGSPFHQLGRVPVGPGPVVRHQHPGHHSGQGRLDTACGQKDPEGQAAHHHSLGALAWPLTRHHHGHRDRGRPDEGGRAGPGGVEHRQHQYRSDVVGHRQGQQEESQAGGTRRPSRARQPRAKAMSVAMGMPQPDDPTPPWLNAT